MRVALSHHKLCPRGGIEGYVWALARRLAAAGHDVHAFVHARPAAAPDGVRVHCLGRPPLPRALDVLHFALASHRAIARESFDVVHGFSYGYHQDVYTEGSGAYRDFLARTLPLRSGPSRFLRRHGLARRALEWIEAQRYGPRGARRVLAMSALSRGSIVARYPEAAAASEVLYVGVDRERFAAERLAPHRARIRELAGVRPEERVLLFVGSDYRRKGLGTLLRALAILRRGGAPARAIVVGRERPRRLAAFRAQARALGVEGAVFFAGMQADVAPFFAAADLFVFPSHFDAFGLVILEAMAAGLPVIASARAGASECVRAGETGEVFADPDDAEAVAAIVARSLAEDVRRRQGEAARREAARYSWEEHLARLVEVYGEVAAERREARIPRGEPLLARESPIRAGPPATRALP
jgi:UDP-glucose:(heptosyl)LPS alpha-1,3-glucosyltransferase